MKFDIFFSICQTEVDGFLPSERFMFENFFDQLKLADELGYETAWVAETHLSCEIQKTGPQAVIPHFKGEIGLNTDILQLAHVAFQHTKKIGIGSAIRNILCNGGPIAHAEAIRTFFAFREMMLKDERRLNIGFAAGRFEFSNRPYGVVPRDAIEMAAWPVVKGKIFLEATEIFLRLLKGEAFSSSQVTAQFLRPRDFRTPEEWIKVQNIYGEPVDQIQLEPFYNFERLAVVPRDVRLDNLSLVIGTHDPAAQILANEFMPVGVFNLSITQPAVIEETHKRMLTNYHPAGGGWKRWFMPRTAMIFIDDTKGWSTEAKIKKAKQKAAKAWENYWRAMEGTIDQKKIDEAVANTIAGDPQEVLKHIREKYHPEDRLMAWFDFNNHDNDELKSSMRIFMEQVAPSLGGK